ncbi:uncharacterized protein LOC142464628 [Ascaphus truei]|uniref:uncharacterized protein LOC142464628 n=1 Tax=Ascaphus truei TaxID=8439 RepID=UPI003F59C780
MTNPVWKTRIPTYKTFAITTQRYKASSEWLRHQNSGSVQAGLSDLVRVLGWCRLESASQTWSGCWVSAGWAQSQTWSVQAGLSLRPGQCRLGSVSQTWSGCWAKSLRPGQGAGQSLRPGQGAGSVQAGLNLSDLVRVLGQCRLGSASQTWSGCWVGAGWAQPLRPGQGAGSVQARLSLSDLVRVLGLCSLGSVSDLVRVLGKVSLTWSEFWVSAGWALRPRQGAGLVQAGISLSDLVRVLGLCRLGSVSDLVSAGWAQSQTWSGCWVCAGWAQSQTWSVQAGLSLRPGQGAGLSLSDLVRVLGKVSQTWSGCWAKSLRPGQGAGSVQAVLSLSDQVWVQAGLSLSDLVRVLGLCRLGSVSDLVRVLGQCRLGSVSQTWSGCWVGAGWAKSLRPGQGAGSVQGGLSLRPGQGAGSEG